MKSSEQFIYEQEMQFEKEKRMDKKTSLSILEYIKGQSINKYKITTNANRSNKQQPAERTNTLR